MEALICRCFGRTQRTNREVLIEPTEISKSVCYLEWAGHVRACVAHVDEPHHGHTNEQPAEKAHEVQQAVDVPQEEDEYSDRILQEAKPSTIRYTSPVKPVTVADAGVLLRGKTTHFLGGMHQQF